MNVLSLFDGMSGGQIALERAGVKVDKYFASEIEPNAIKITMKNYPDTVQLGDVQLLNPKTDVPKIDLLLGGSPCQDLSPTRRDDPERTKGLEGSKSKLYYEYLHMLDNVNPRYFLLENVNGMPDKDRDIITSDLGVQPIMIDSAHFSAQSRERLYWTNIPVHTPLPPIHPDVLQDIMESDVPEKMFYKQTYNTLGMDKRVCGTLDINTIEMLKRIYNPAFKAPTLTAVTGGYQEKKVMDNGRPRKLTPIEYERLQTVPDNYTAGVNNTARYSMLGNGWTIDVIAYILKGGEWCK